MKVLAFRHVPFEHLGTIQPALAARGIAVEYADLYVDSARLPKPADYAGLVFMGGPMSVNDVLPYLDREMRWIAEAVDRGQPVLGVCLGSQLIARALGAPVYRNPCKEIGWYELELTAEGASDPLFACAGPRETVFQWHGETFDLPPGAVHLARSALCRNQAFRAGTAYGFQFHLEVTPSMIADWCEQDANAGDIRELPGPIDPHANAARLGELSLSVFGKWADLVVAAQWPAESA